MRAYSSPVAATTMWPRRATATTRTDTPSTTTALHPQGATKSVRTPTHRSAPAPRALTPMSRRFREVRDPCGEAVDQFGDRSRVLQLEVVAGVRDDFEH